MLGPIHVYRARGVAMARHEAERCCHAATMLKLSTIFRSRISEGGRVEFPALAS